jgi:hypothetical protein
MPPALADLKFLGRTPPNELDMARKVGLGTAISLRYFPQRFLAKGMDERG